MVKPPVDKFTYYSENNMNFDSGNLILKNNYYTIIL